MKKGLKIFIFSFIGLVFLILFFTSRVNRFFEIDKCLDSGGSWNYILEKCEYSDSLMLQTDSILCE